jgi:hypothetical protein
MKRRFFGPDRIRVLWQDLPRVVADDCSRRRALDEAMRSLEACRPDGTRPGQRRPHHDPRPLRPPYATAVAAMNAAHGIEP